MGGRLPKRFEGSLRRSDAVHLAAPAVGLAHFLLKKSEHVRQVGAIFRIVIGFTRDVILQFLCALLARQRGEPFAPHIGVVGVEAMCRLDHCLGAGII